MNLVSMLCAAGLVLLVPIVPASAATIGFEDVAPAGGSTVDNFPRPVALQSHPANDRKASHWDHCLDLKEDGS